MSQQDESPIKEPSLPWRFVRLDQFRPPPEPTRERVRRGFLGLWDRLRKGHAHAAESASESAAAEVELVSMSSDLLAEAAPPPVWFIGAAALHKALTNWWNEPSGKTQVLVGAPFSGTAEIAVLWAQAFECQVLPEPPLDQIKSGGNKWLERIDQIPHPVWVIPHLERFFLRHSQGFALLRVLLDKITRSRARFLLVADSWAWAYLSKALHINALFPMPLTLDAFDHEKLGQWLYGLAAKTPHKNYVFRQADSGNLIMPQAESFQEEGGKKRETSDFLQHLAAFSRGNPGVAHSIWRYSLRLAQKEEIQPEAQEAAANDVFQETIWVEPWSQLHLPPVSRLSSGDRDLFILHTLLLHNSLSSQLLAHILPFPEPQIRSILQVLQVEGFLVNDNDNWRIATLAYPAVREFLRDEGYLVDAL